MIVMEKQRDLNNYGSYRAEVTTTSTSDAVILRPHVKSTSVGLYATSGAYVEYTLSTLDKVEAGTADWIVWPLGVVSANSTDSIMSTVTAVRAVSESGDSVTIEVVA
ncbi:MAG: hypothetical protein ACN2B6_11905 [Rickettsiales bacterium]